MRLAGVAAARPRRAGRGRRGPAGGVPGTLLIGALLGLGASSAGAAVTAGPAPSPRADTLPTGRIVERVASSADPDQAYALFLPSAFDRNREWPVLFLLDARGRALLPLRLYRAAAERYGYVVLSAYGTYSDGPVEPNERALDALLADAQERWSADTRRLYLVGFSGTARMSWIFARLLGGHVAGIVGYGATLPSHMEARDFAELAEAPFSFFGGSGYGDFNYDETVALRSELEPLGIPSQVRHWEGGHGWPPPEVATASVEWIEAHAMAAGLTETRPAWIEARRDAALAQAEALVDDGRLLEARERLRALLEAVRGVVEPGPVDERLRRLEASDAYRRALEDHRVRARRHRELRARLGTLSLAAWQDDDPPEVERWVERLEIEELLARAGSDDRAEAAAARRVLEDFASHLTFALVRSWTGVGKFEHALAALEVAETIFPERRARLCYSRALVFAVEGEAAETLEQAECVLRASPEAARRLLAEPALGSLAGDSRLEDLRERAGGRSLR